MIDDNEQSIAVAEVGEDSEDLPAPVTEPSEPEAVPMDANSVQALAQRVFSISIAKEFQAERLAQDKQRAQELAARVTSTQIVNEAQAKYVADPSDANCELFRNALLTLAIGVVKQLHMTDWRLLEPAVNHCIKQVQRGMYKPDPSAKFATWAAKVMRNKLRDSMRKVWRAKKRKARMEAKEDAEAYEKHARIMRKYKRTPKFEFTREEVKTACKQLRPKQARLLELKDNGARSGKIAKELNLALPQLYNRWARLRKRVRQLVKPTRIWLKPR
jgi:RNA polymerase sigma factor (sigma-70 family)